MTRPHPPRTRFERRAAGVVRDARRTLAADIRTAREDAGLSARRLARSAGVSDSTIRAIERDDVEPSLQVLGRVAIVLGLSLSVRLYPGTGPLVRDHLQASMLDALLATLDGRWQPRPEVTVYRPIRGVIDLVLEAHDEPAIACEAQSDLRRIEQQVRWSRAKADALGLARTAAHGPSVARPVARLLLLRSTTRTRAIVALHADLISAAYPGRTTRAHASLVGRSPWPGDAIVWCDIRDGVAALLDRPPRGITVGR